jgi:hypothetical protein
MVPLLHYIQSNHSPSMNHFARKENDLAANLVLRHQPTYEKPPLFHNRSGI